MTNPAEVVFVCDRPPVVVVMSLPCWQSAHHSPKYAFQEQTQTENLLLELNLAILTPENILFVLFITEV